MASLAEEAAAYCSAWERSSWQALEVAMKAARKGSAKGEDLAALVEKLLEARAEAKWVWDYFRHVRAAGTGWEEDFPPPVRRIK